MLLKVTDYNVKKIVLYSSSSISNVYLIVCMIRDRYSGRMPEALVDKSNPQPTDVNINFQFFCFIFTAYFLIYLIFIRQNLDCTFCCWHLHCVYTEKQLFITFPLLVISSMYLHKSFHCMSFYLYVMLF